MADLLDQYDEGEEPEPGCKRCRSQDCIWVWTGVRWKLVEEGGKPHVCPVTTEGMENLDG